MSATAWTATSVTVPARAIPAPTAPPVSQAPTPPLLSSLSCVSGPSSQTPFPALISVTFSFLAWLYLLARLLHELLLRAHPHSLVLGSVVLALSCLHLYSCPTSTTLFPPGPHSQSLSATWLLLVLLGGPTEWLPPPLQLDSGPGSGIPCGPAPLLSTSCLRMDAGSGSLSMPPSSGTRSCAWYSQVGVGQGLPPRGSKSSCQFLGFLASDKGAGWETLQCQIKQAPTQEEEGRGVQLGWEHCCHHYFCSAVRSNLIPSPPTYNLAYNYISWESFSNVSYYTRILPSVPQDCPTPMGTKGNGKG